MTRGDEELNAIALTVACPVCEIDPGNRCVSTTLPMASRIKDRPHYARYELAVQPAIDEAVQKLAEPESKEILLSLVMMSTGNSEAPRQFRIDRVDDAADTHRSIYLDEHQFALFISGHVVKVTEEP